MAKGKQRQALAVAARLSSQVELPGFPGRAVYGTRKRGGAGRRGGRREADEWRDELAPSRLRGPAFRLHQGRAHDATVEVRIDREPFDYREYYRRIEAPPIHRH
jgi:hypothetical protein